MGVDAVISDIFKPRMDGYRFCCEVRSEKSFVICRSFSIPPATLRPGMRRWRSKWIRRVPE